MLVYTVLRHAWRATLAVLPQPVLARLDRWSQAVAERRAERRRRLLMQRSRQA